MSTVNPLARLKRLGFWYDSSMANRIVVWAMVVSMSIVLAVGSTAYITMHGLLEDMVNARLDAAARLGYQRLHDRLDRDVRSVDELARHSLVANGLEDARGRGRYLRPFLAEHQESRPELLDIGLYDWTGGSLASAGGRALRRHGLVAEVVNSEKSVTWLLSAPDGYRLLAAAPVRAAGGAGVEGALVSEISLAVLARGSLARTSPDIQLRLVDPAGGTVFAPGGAGNGEPTLEVGLALEAEPLMNQLGKFRVVASMPRSEAEWPLQQLRLAFLALVLGAAVLAYWAARRLARGITGPLARLSTHAQEIASDGLMGLREVEVRGHDEVAWMGMAFNAMVRSLRDVYTEQELRVRDRTRELERRELYLRAILDNFPFMIWLKDEESRFLAVNRVMSDACGRNAPEDMVGLTDMDVWPEDLAEYYRADDRAIMDSRREKVVEEPISEQGSRKWFETFKKPVIDEGGRVLGTVGFARDITERKQAEKAMRLRDRAIMSTSDGIVITDMTRPEQPIIFVNPAFEAITGYTAQESLGRNCRFLRGNDTDQPGFEEVRMALREQRECRVVLRNYRKDGTPFWNDLTLSPVRDDHGVVTHYVGVQHDITETLEAGQALEASERRLALAMDALREGLWDWNMLDDSLYHSPSWAHMMGYAVEEMTGDPRSFRRCLPDDERPRVADALRAHLHGDDETFACDHRMIRKDGSEVWVSDRGKVVEWTEDGRPARMVGTISDISERYRAEREIMSWMQRLDSILTMSPDGFVYFDARGHVASVNLAFEKMTGLLSGHVLDLPISDFVARLRGLAEPSQPFPNLVQQFLGDPGKGAASQKAEGRNQTAYIHLLQPEPRVLAFELRVNASGDSSVLYLRDVTRETEVDRMKSEFLSTAAHELRTPMVSIMGFSELLLRRRYNPETAKDMLETIHRQSKRLTGLLNELLDLARIEARAGKDFDYNVQPLAVVVRDSVAATASRGDGGEVRLVIEEGLPLVRIDAAKVQQAVLNILSNAFKYSPEGGDVEVRMFARETAAGRQVCVTVGDRGIGMTPEQAARVFERFFRADPSGNIPGTGLGMSLVKEIMEIHGGGVDVASEPGQGTMVTLWLPAANSEARALAA